MELFFRLKASSTLSIKQFQNLKLTIRKLANISYDVLISSEDTAITSLASKQTLTSIRK